MTSDNVLVENDNEIEKLNKRLRDQEESYAALLIDRNTQIQNIVLLRELNGTLEKLANSAITKMEEMQHITSRTNVEPHNIGSDASVKLVFKDVDYEHITPIITITNDSFEQLFRIRAIDDTQSGNDNAIRLALLNLAREALEQICSDFIGDID